MSHTERRKRRGGGKEQAQERQNEAEGTAQAQGPTPYFIGQICKSFQHSCDFRQHVLQLSFFF